MNEAIILAALFFLCGAALIFEYRHTKLIILLTAVIIVLIALANFGVFEGTSEPSAARAFAYEHMTQKDNVVICEKKHGYGYESTLWITDCSGVDYQAQNFWLWWNIHPNHTYNIKFIGGGFFNKLWEADEVI